MAGLSRAVSCCSTSCVATVLMGFYIFAACVNLYRLMFPLAFMDLQVIDENQFVKPLWKAKEKLQMRVYLSTKKDFNPSFVQSEFDEATSQNNNQDAVLLWKEELQSSSVSKSFLLTKLGQCTTSSNEECTTDESYNFASQWLDNAEEKEDLESSGNILSTMQAAGQGIESTSFLLTLYQSILSAFTSTNNETTSKQDGNIIGRPQRAVIPLSQPIWSALVSNSTLHVHALVMKFDSSKDSTPTNYEEAIMSIRRASRSYALLHGGTELVKYEPPHHITKPGRVLVYDLVYVFQRYIMMSSSLRPPWDMEYAKPEYYKAYQMAQTMKEKNIGYPYWKPEVAIKYLIDEDSYPYHMAESSGMQLVRVQQSRTHPTGIAHIPALYVDEIGLTSDKYVPINETVTTVPLRVSVGRSDVDWSEDHYSTTRSSSTATSGGISPSRWRLLTHLSQSIENQKQLGFEQSDIDDLRRLIADTNVTLLGITMLASALHLLFEFLTFQSDVKFWQNNQDLTGLSVRSLFLDMIGQVIIVLFLIEKDSSLLMTIPSAIGCLIALWKCQRAAGLKFIRVDKNASSSTTTSWWNIVPGLFGYELRASRLDQVQQQASSSSSPSDSKHDNKNDKKKSNKTSTTTSSTTSKNNSKAHLAAMSLESDRIATQTLATILLPMVGIYTLYSFCYEEHVGWYSWLITSASSAVYALGFVLMTPQLFLNWKLKSVAHLPWKVLIYKSLNTFIDDLFSFIIRMPTMARISCFRDDVVFLIYLYQRWLYPVDKSRPVEGGFESPNDSQQATQNDKNNNNETSTTPNNNNIKKNQ